MTKQQEIDSLKAKVLALEANDKRIRLTVKELNDTVQNLAYIIVNTQKVLARVIAVSVILEKKGLISGKELAEVQEEQENAFVTKAHPEFAKEMLDQSRQAGSVESGDGNGRPVVSGNTGTGGSGASDKLPQEGERGSRIIRLPELRAAHGDGNGTPSVGTPEAKDIPVGPNNPLSNGDAIGSSGGSGSNKADIGQATIPASNPTGKSDSSGGVESQG